MKRFLLFIFAFCWVVAAYAHKPSDSYLALSIAGDKVVGQWDIALRDLDFAIGLDANGDGQITWGEVRAKHGEIAAYAMARLQLSSDGKECPTQLTQHLIDDHTDGAYAVLRFQAQCSTVLHTLKARYNLFFDIDPQHKGLLRLEYQGVSAAGVFTPENANQQFTLQQPNHLTQFLAYGTEGVWHIWKGYDHILFLLALLLPAVAVRREKQWEGIAAFKPAFYSVLKVVTAFTVAHSVTLTLATLGIISLPSRLVESTIAASVVIAALNNVFPLFRDRWIMAFIFGLIHGFGFASVLSELGLPKEALALALVGFNLGVEAGQLVIVSLFLPLAFSLRQTKFYRIAILLTGSIIIAILAGIWFAERAFDFKILPF
ncbi:MAG: HupE/UreJ family protein [Burkholderiales bacterium]|nr:HupE/UreJ family protein [Burkholderiales bacterium]